MRFLVALLVLFGLGACSPGDAPRIAEPHTLGELRVATRIDAHSFVEDDDGERSGFEHDLVVELGRHLGLPVRFMVFPDSARAIDAVLNGQAHLAAAGLGRNDRLPLRWSAALREVDYILVGRDEGPEIGSEAELAGRTVSVRRGSLPAQAVTAIRKRQPATNIHHPPRFDDQGMLARLAAGELDLVATDHGHLALAAQIHPGLGVKYDLPLTGVIAWAMPLGGVGELPRAVEEFLAQAGGSMLLARIEDRYFGYVRRVTKADSAAFLARVEDRLPAFRRHFEEAQDETGIDWRLVAALAYQESHWDPLARSRTGVRGMMMLTAETADSLGVADRLDARESILGGARYLAALRERLPEEVPEPDRTWMAIAAYNLGMGHFNGGRAIARGLGRDETSWWDMKAVLPLLSRPEYAARLKSGPARGGEAVIMTENVRSFYGMLVRLEPPHAPPAWRPALGLRGAAPSDADHASSLEESLLSPP